MKNHFSPYLLLSLLVTALGGWASNTLRAQEPQFWLSIGLNLQSQTDPGGAFLKKYAYTPPLNADQDANKDLTETSNWKCNGDIELDASLLSLKQAQSWIFHGNCLRATFAETKTFTKDRLLDVAQYLKNHKVKQLEIIGFEDLNAEQAAHFFSALGASGTLETLRWEGSHTPRETFISEDVFYQLLIHNKKISNIEILAKNYFQINLQTLTQLLLSTNLKSITINGTPTTKSDGSDHDTKQTNFCAYFGLPQLKTLKLLNYPDITKNTVVKILERHISFSTWASALEKKLNISYQKPHLKTLSLAGCSIDDDAFKNLFAFLKNSIEHLEVQNCNKLTYDVIRTIYGALKDRLNQLQSLCIQDTAGISYCSLLALQGVMPQLSILPKNWKEYTYRYHNADKYANTVWFALNDSQRFTLSNIATQLTGGNTVALATPEGFTTEEITEHLKEETKFLESFLEHLAKMSPPAPCTEPVEASSPPQAEAPEQQIPQSSPSAVPVQTQEKSVPPPPAKEKTKKTKKTKKQNRETSPDKQAPADTVGPSIEVSKSLEIAPPPDNTAKSSFDPKKVGFAMPLDGGTWYQKKSAPNGISIEQFNSQQKFKQ